MNDEQHYNDGYVDIRDIPEFCLWTFTTDTRHTKTLCFDDNFYRPLDIVDCYRDMIALMDEERLNESVEELVNAVKAWMMENGCPEEELIED